MASLLLDDHITINDNIRILAPSVGQVLTLGEGEYFGAVSALIATPFEMMAQLHLSGIDYESITEFELFAYALTALADSSKKTRLIFGEMDLSGFHPAKNRENDELILWNQEQDIVMDKHIHSLIASALRKILFVEKPVQKAGNKEAKEFLIRRAVEKYQRQLRRPAKPFLEELVIAMVNTEQFKYNYEETMNLSLYKFNASVRQIPRRIHFDHLMGGVYAGTVDVKSIQPKELNWLSQG